MFAIGVILRHELVSDELSQDYHACIERSRLLMTSAGNETACEFACKQDVEGCLFLSRARTYILPDKLLVCQVIDDIKTLSSKLTITFL